jgi:hypothetical protein
MVYQSVRTVYQSVVTSINCSNGLLNSGRGLVNCEYGWVNHVHGIKTKLFLYIVVFRGSVNKQSWWYECLFAGLLCVQHVELNFIELNLMKKTKITFSGI